MYGYRSYVSAFLFGYSPYYDCTYYVGTSAGPHDKSLDYSCHHPPLLQSTIDDDDRIVVTTTCEVTSWQAGFAALRWPIEQVKLEEIEWVWWYMNISECVYTYLYMHVYKCK